MQKRRSLLLIGVAAIVLSSCKQSDEFTSFFNKTIGPVFGVKLESADKTVQVTPTPKTPEEQKAWDHRELNAEFIRELYSVVLQREVTEDEFVQTLNAIDQGGHYDALYNGLVSGAEYRLKEKGNSPIGALKIYAEIMAQVKLDQRYDPLSIKAENGENQSATIPTSSDKITPPQPSEAERSELVNQYQQDALGKPFYTLKRQLGQEVLNTIELKKEYKEKLATWFGRFTVFLNKKGVDFGVPGRNKTSEYYHYKWALDSDEERLKWECLNRIHRLMNAQTK